ncbi:kinase-like domain-containing protein [Fennellomyces sp. T-0311]|nr:kinase-like domain-containing protein [Fennellomyces sp. T-0311]
MTTIAREAAAPPLRSEASHGSSATDSSRVLGSTSTGRTSARSFKRASGSQARRPSSIHDHHSPVSPTPFAAARATAASLRKQRSAYKPPSDFKSVWRSPGCNCQIPDIIKEAYQRLQQLHRSHKVAPADDKKEDPTPNLHRDPWRPVFRSPDIIPLPPITKAPKQHAVFDAKVRKVLPRSKILELNPRDIYIGMERVGSGANGAVISASKRSSKKAQVAIKRCYIEDHDTHHHTYILRELRIMGCMSHTNLIELTEACMWGDYLWMAMELMTCSVFGLLFNVSVGLPESYAVRIAHEVLEGLVYLHARNYMHRDVKCENILLSRSGQVKLADFGLATPLNKTNSARLGTAKWMAPEVVSETPYTENVDIWSLAITMIEMMDRVPPLYYLDGNREIFAEILYGQQPNFNFTMPSPAMAELIAWMLDSDGKRRPGAKCVLTRIKQEMMSGGLKCARPADLGALVQEVFPADAKPKQQQEITEL